MSASAASGHAPALEEPRLGEEATPRPLGSAWEWPQAGLWSNLLVLLRGPAPPQGWPVGPYFLDAWIRGRNNWQLIFLSALLHVLLVVFPLRFRFGLSRSAAETAPKQVEVAWTGSSSVLLPYIPAFRKESRKAAPHHGVEAARRGADKFHPRQTIISKPEVATHPRQTLIEPAVSPEPPKILPPLPNIVEWPSLPAPPPPRRHLKVDSHTRMRQKLARPQAPVVAPNVPAALPDMTLTSQHVDLPKPALEVKTTARPTFQAGRRTDEAAPEIHAAPSPDLAGQKLIALSEAPAPPPPNLEVPKGNLNAQFSMSPDAKAPGAGGTTASGSAVAPSDHRGGNGHGGEIPGISISAAKHGPVSDMAGPPGLYGDGSGVGLRPPSRVVPRQPGIAALSPDDASVPQQSIQERIKAALHPEDLLAPGRIYTMHVSMPNLASVTGTWTLKFVELDANGKEIPNSAGLDGIEGPEPMRKVDPKYPPEYVSARVQGDVVLYAIIRRDGSVDSIEVVRSLDPQLDQNAMEALSRWKFRAAERAGHPVELAAIVRIPFRATMPAF